jgi:LysR family transcriptional regulator, chromosome initiation inhibitor
MQFRYDQLSALVAVVREGTFDGAARTLHVTPSAVSQRIRQLEEQVGHTVVVRGTPCTPTGIGESIYRHALQVELLEKELVGAVTPAGAEADAARLATPMTVAVNADSLATWLVPALADFVDRTGLRIEIVLDDQDHTAGWLRSGRVLGAVTAEARPVQGCRVQPLGVMRYLATASPAFVKRWFAGGVNAQSLWRAPALSFNRKDELQERFVRRVMGGRRGELRAHLVPSPLAYVEASLLGLGWGMNPELLAAVHVKSKRLIDLAAGRWLDVPLFWQQWGLASDSLDKLSAALSTRAAASLRPM